MAVPLYDSYLYLLPGWRADEDVLFARYLHNLGGIYDLMAVPEDPLPDRFAVYEWDGAGAPDGATAIHQRAIQDLAHDKNWVVLGERRCLRAYVADKVPDTVRTAYCAPPVT
jgi:hypothetical protein